jgi:hypothetical protein
MRIVIAVVLGLLMVGVANAAPPAAPELLRVHQAPCAYNLPGAALEWSPVADAERYRVYWSGIQQRELAAQLGNLGPQYYHRWFVPVGDDDEYWVTAVNALDEESLPSNTIALVTTGCGELPTQPLSFAAVPTGCNSVLLTWVPGAAGERRIWILKLLRVFPSQIHAYRIRRATDADLTFLTSTSARTFLDWHLGENGGEPDNYYFDDGSKTPRYGEPLAGGGTYYYVIQAVNAEGNRSQYSEVVSVTMPPCGP